MSMQEHEKAMTARVDQSHSINNLADGSAIDALLNEENSHKI